jgi:hypothetical protein
MSRGKGTDGPEDVDATFAAIVADLRAEGVGVISDDTADAAPEKSSREQEQSPERGSGWRGGGTEWDTTIFSGDPAADDDDDEDARFVPPEPPPLPRPRKSAIIVLLFFVLGLFLLIAPNLIGIGTTVATPLGILSLATGIALLLLRVRQGPPPGADPSNGAQV